MPSTTKSKVQPQTLTLSKHVKSLLTSGDSVTSASFSAQILSGIPRRSRSTAVLNDDLLLQIKKGLESSVHGSKSKVKVKRLSGAVKHSVKISQKESLIKVSEIDLAKGALLTTQQTLEMASTGQLSDAYTSSYMRNPNFDHQSQSKDTLVEAIPSAKSSPSSENDAKKSTYQLIQTSPSNVYNLRSRPEIPVSFVVPPSSSSKQRMQRGSKIKKHSSSPKSLTATPGLELAKEEATKIGKPRKRKISDSPLTDFAQPSSIVQNRWTDKKPKISDQHSLQLQPDTDRLETPRAAYRKRKSAVNVDREIQYSSKKQVSVSVKSTPSELSLTDTNNMKLQIRVSRIEECAGDISVHSLSGKSPQIYFLSKNIQEGKTAALNSNESQNNAKVACLAMEATVSNATSLIHKHLSEQPASVIDSTPAAVTNDLISSTTRRARDVRWDTSAVKTHLIESILPNRRLTRSSYYSNAAVDTDFDAVVHSVPTKIIPQFTPRSILKTADSSSLSTVTELQVTNRHICFRLCQYLLLLGLPVALAAYAYSVLTP